MTDTFRALCAELLRGLDENRHPEVRYPGHLRLVMATARAELAQPEPEGPSEDDLRQLLFDSFRGAIEFICDAEEEAHLMIRSHVKFATAVLSRWGRPTPQPPADGEVAEVMRRLTELAHAVTRENWREFDMRVPAEPLRDADLVLTRAVELLQLQHPQPVPPAERTVLVVDPSPDTVGRFVPMQVFLVEREGRYVACYSMVDGRPSSLLLQRQQPVAVSDRLPGRIEQALIKAECALSDIAEGEAEESEGDPLEWAEKRAADALARIRPVMRQRQIHTSEWPPLPAHALPAVTHTPPTGSENA